MSATLKTKRIDPRAYNALAEALAVIYWNKKPWARYLRGVLRDVPEILSGLDFYGDTKRETAGRIVDRLMADEARYQAVTIALMLSVANMDSFPNLEGQDDSTQMLKQARDAVAELHKWTKWHQAIIDEHERYAADIAEASEKASANRVFSEAIRKLKDQFLAMHGNTREPSS